ncbi:hypothetical protein DL769_002614 [Monosporascus sp. CRB-8-3]|nr:hypothetical protein DL769_002614 [Monosporascus sp. CRB-8-3]
MDPFTGSTNDPTYTSHAAGQPPVTEIARSNNNEVMVAWNHLKLQVNSFNAIVSIQAETFRTWSIADRSLIIDLMKAVSDATVDNTGLETPSSYVNSTAGVSKRKNKSKAPASGIRRPRNSWILFRSARQAEINRVEGPIPNNMMSTRLSQEWKRLPPEQKKRWKDLARAEKLQHARENPHYKYQPRRSSEIKKRRTRKVSGMLSVSSPATSTATLSVAGTSETILSTEDSMTGGSIAGDNQMSTGELLAHYAIYQNLPPVVDTDGPIAAEDQEGANQPFLNYTHNPTATFGVEPHVYDESAYATGTNDAFEDGEDSFDFDALLSGNMDPALQDHEAVALGLPLEGGSDIDSLFGDPNDMSGYSMMDGDWMDMMNRENFDSP